MTSTNFIRLVLYLCLLIAWSCTKNTTKVNQTTSVKAFSEYLGKPITIDVKGQVLDNAQLPKENVKIYIGKKSTTTDHNGHFSIKNVSANENLLTIKVYKKGYKSELINLTPKSNIKPIDITLYKDNELSLFWFNKNNHNLSQNSN